MKNKKTIVCVLFFLGVMFELEGSQAPDFVEPAPKKNIKKYVSFTLKPEQVAMFTQLNKKNADNGASSSAADCSSAPVLTPQDLLQGSQDDLKDVLDDLQDALNSPMQWPTVQSKKASSSHKK